MTPVLPRIREMTLFVRNTDGSPCQLGFGSHTVLGKPRRVFRWASEGQGSVALVVRSETPQWGTLQKILGTHGFAMTYAMVKGKEMFSRQVIQWNKVFGGNRKCLVHFLWDCVAPPWTLAFWILVIILEFRQPACPCGRGDSEQAQASRSAWMGQPCGKLA